MLSQTLDEGLRNYEIGEKVRALRLRKKMALVELGRHTGLSAALLSKIERSNIFPPLPTLLRIAMVFGVGLDYFFSDDSGRRTISIVRKHERVRFPDTTEGRVSYFFESLDFKTNDRKLNAHYAEFQPAPEDEPSPHLHSGAEFIHILSGRLALKIGRQEHLLDEGDSIYFDSSVPHSYRRHGKPKCTAVVITTP
ncbi:MAG TPA: XRE family transcriptional regulator [Thermoanaerobaculia bacterium]|nr:XRE family transcriptional regulator [Thermoanaerobaculia bacterium]